MIGSTISHYKILSELGRGGMGVVYKAEDTKLERTVALKFLASHLLEDKEGRARFIREAKAAAALDHPNICTVHEIDEIEGETFIAMAFIEGLTVKDKIAQRPLKLDQALDIAVQTAQGLQAAHEKGIVHRDIKSANIMVTPQGQVKIMDFGLAQLAERSKLTETTTILGTPSYMSPEQAVGEKTDRRTDLWSLGVVLYEMIAGRLPFAGERQEAILYGITSEEPEPVTAQRAGLPLELEWIIGKALAKDRNERYQHAEDLLVDLRSLQKKLASGKSTILRSQGPSPRVVPQAASPTEDLEEHPLAKYRVIENLEEADDSVLYRAEDTQLKRLVDVRVVPQSSAQRIERAQRRKQTAVLGAGALGVLLALTFAFFPLFSPTPVAETPLRRFAIALPVSVTSDVGGGGLLDNSLAISPNARHIAFVEAGGQGRLWVQDLDQEQPHALEGTEGATSPFWSPDSTVIGFAAGGDLKKISVRGGLASLVCELPAVHFHGGTWSPDGEVIVFSSGPRSQPHSLYQVPAPGGAPGLLLAPEDLDQASVGPGEYLAWSHFLPPEAGARVLVFTFGTPSEQTMVVQDLETGQRELLGPGAAPVYSNSGHLVYATSPTSSDFWALPFSLETLRATGEAFPVSENSRYVTVAADETLVYLDMFGLSGQQQLVWVDRDGKKVAEIGQAQQIIREAALSPDGRWVAVAVLEGSNWDVWVWDLARGVSTRLSTAPELDLRPVWSAGGDEVAFMSFRAGNPDIYLRRADGGGEEQALAATSQLEVPSDWSRDGKYLLYQQTGPETGSDLWYLERVEDGSGWAPRPFLQEPSLQDAPKFSPNGRYVAYVSDESGRLEVYVQPFPGGGRKVTVSSGGGSQVRWSRDGKELFYVEGERLMVVAVSTEREFSVSSLTKLFEHPGLRRGLNYPNYDVSLDGRRFILPEPAGYDETEAPQATIRVVQNWFAEFKERQQD